MSRRNKKITESEFENQLIDDTAEEESEVQSITFDDVGVIDYSKLYTDNKSYEETVDAEVETEVQPIQPSVEKEVQSEYYNACESAKLHVNNNVYKPGDVIPPPIPKRLLQNGHVKVRNAG